MKDHSKIADYLRGLGLHFKQDPGKEHVSVKGGSSFTTRPESHWGDGKPLTVYHNEFELWEGRDGTMVASAEGRGPLGIRIEGVPLDEALEFLRRRYKP